jgi:DNA/RNA-binding domain of Phe-tRNA-synthetase-like protein
MRFSVDPAVFAAHPDAAIAVIVASGIHNDAAPAKVAGMLREAESAVRTSMNEESFKTHPHIAAMQEVHRSFGSNPNKFPPSVQALVKRVLKGGQLPSINTLVDCYNVISLRHVVCVGAEDIDVCTGDIRLTFADGAESFKPLGEEANDPPLPGELIYKDDAGAICRKLNWREGDRTKITKDTKNAIIVIEGFSPIDAATLQSMTGALAELVRRFCGGDVRMEILTTEKADVLLYEQQYPR